MSKHTNPLAHLGDEVDAAGVEFARAALGVPDNATLIPMDVGKLAIFLAVQPDGAATMRLGCSKRDAADAFRRLADQLDAQLKAK